MTVTDAPGGITTDPDPTSQPASVPRSNSNGSGPVASAGSALALVVTDLRETMTELRSRGVVFEDYDIEDGPKTVDGVAADEAGGAAAWFTDSEGNIVNLVQLPPGFPLP